MCAFRIPSGSTGPPFAAPNSQSTPKFHHSLLFTLLPINPRATLPHGRPVPAQISKLPLRLPPAAHRRQLPTTHHSLPTTHCSLPTAHFCYLLCFLSH